MTLFGSCSALQVNLAELNSHCWIESVLLNTVFSLLFSPDFSLAKHLSMKHAVKICQARILILSRNLTHIRNEKMKYIDMQSCLIKPAGSNSPMTRTAREVQNERAFDTASHRALGSPGGSAGEEFACNVGDLGSIPGLGRSPGGGMATHSSIPAWENS